MFYLIRSPVFMSAQLPDSDSDSSDDILGLGLGLEVCGKACCIHDDEATAVHLDAEVHLISWRDKCSDTMDRFDCRLLLDSYSDASMGARTHKAVSDEDDAACDKLRWRGIVLDADGSDANVFPRHGESPTVDADVDDTAEPNRDQESAAPVCTFHHPALSKPAYILPHFTAGCSRRPLLPVIYIIISRTARLVSLCGRRIDTMLRIRYGALSCFSFLYAHHELRPFFDAMVEASLHAITH
jgi:hypothetical protein